MGRNVILGFGEHPIGRFGQMAGNRDGSSAVAFAGLQPRIEIADMPIERASVVRCTDGGFDESPLQIEIDKAGCAPMRCFTTRREDPRHQSAIAGQLFGPVKTADIADLERNHRSKNLTDAWRGL